MILSIDTSGDEAMIVLTGDTEVVDHTINSSKKDHASWLHTAIRDLLAKNKTELASLQAVAVNNGPGSYTGLRISLSAAKGFCFALGCPLITLDGLELIASSVADEAEDLIVPMIDARRDEVFTAVYDRGIRVNISTHTMILTHESFADLLVRHKIIFCGSGAHKAAQFIHHENARFSSVTVQAAHISSLSRKYFSENRFADLAYAAPFYAKEFYSQKPL